MASGPPWTTPSELGEYAFCPRACHYRREGGGASSPEATRGSVYHRRTLASERWRDEHRAAPWLAVAVGLVLITLAMLAVLL